MLYCKNKDLKIDINKFLAYYEFSLMDYLNNKCTVEFENVSPEDYRSFCADQLQTWHLGCYGSKGSRVDKFNTYLRKFLELKI